MNAQAFRDKGKYDRDRLIANLPGTQIIHCLSRGGAGQVRFPKARRSSESAPELCT